ncbi:hypothetical protein [Corynebacterium ulceribovis]|uniref:hypothetical protein n=1 Tax=Corynebacterium ulceribovis TaxID=487732 RepID=UPI00039E9129|nr:hypothetical protein [Corynebacterium ulceribovis]
MNSSQPMGHSGHIEFDIATGQTVGKDFQVAGDAISMAYAALPEFPSAAAGAGFTDAGILIAAKVASLQARGIELGVAVQLHGWGVHEQAGAFSDTDTDTADVFGGQY